MTEPAKPGMIDRYRARYKWFDHVMRNGAEKSDRYLTSRVLRIIPGLALVTVVAAFVLGPIVTVLQC